MDENQVVVKHDGAVVHVILNRPDRMNALVKPMWPLLTEAFAGLSANDDVRCVVLRGEGKSFSAGTDTSEFRNERGGSAQAEAYGKLMGDTISAIKACPHPVIGAVRGPCAGTGLLLAMLCDLRISAVTGVFGASSSKLGLALPYPEFSILFDALGRSLTLELVLDGRLLEAHEALAKGIVGQVVPEEEFEQAVANLAERVTAGAPLANRWHKSFADRLETGVPLDAEEITASYASFDTEDYREGYNAFLKKQPATFSGK